jgi:EpsI family protein
VDDVCSGLKYLISLTAFGALYAHLSTTNKLQKAVLFALAIPIAFVANVVRVTLMVLVADVVSVEATERWYFHDFFGFALFTVAFLMLFGAEHLFLKRGGPPSSSDGAEAEPADAGPTEVPGGRTLSARAAGRAAWSAAGCLAVAAVLSTYLAWPRATVSASEVLAAVPHSLGDWHGRDTVMDDRVYEILGTRDVLSRVYASDRPETVQLLIVLAQQTRKRTHPPEQCMTGEGFVISDRGTQTVALADGASPAHITFRRLLLSRGSQRRLVWYVYKTGDSLTTGYWHHQARVAMRKLHTPDAADILLRIDATVPEAQLAAAEETLRQFASSHLAASLSTLP